MVRSCAIAAPASKAKAAPSPIRVIGASLFGAISASAPALVTRLFLKAGFGQARGLRTDLRMRAFILSLAFAAAALPALAQAPSRDVLALANRVARVAQPHLEQNLVGLVESLAKEYQDTTLRAGQPVDSKALETVTRSESEAIKPLLWAGMERVYAETYSPDELKALSDFYRDNPGVDPAGLPASLAAKNGDIAAREQALVSQIGPRLIQDFFGDYCSRAACTNETRRKAGLPERAAAN
jgi:hypothetical protein